MSNAQWKMESMIGPLYLVVSEKGLRKIFWTRQPDPLLSSLRDPSPAARVLAESVQQLNEYFAGQRREFSIPFDVEGTDFQRRVWGELKKIPYGKTVSYGDVAKRLQQKGAMRAVGTANGKNPLSIVVPCHRVIAADGTLGGYSGGLAIKRKLLALEGVTK